MPKAQPQPNMIRPVAKIVRDFIVATANDPADYIADRILPAFPVGNEARGQFSIVQRDAYYGEGDIGEDDERQPGGDPNYAKGVKYGFVDYRVKPYNKATVIDDFDERSADIGVDLRLTEFEQLVHVLKIGREKRAANIFFGTGFTGEAASSAPGGIPYSDPALGTPVADLLDVISDVRRASGMPNAIILGDRVANALRVHDTILSAQPTNVDRSAFTESDLLAWLSRKLELPLGFIGRAQYNTNPAGLAVSLDDVWGNQIWIGHISPNGNGLGRRGPQGSFSANRVAVVRPVMKEWEPYEIQQTKHKTEVGIDIEEDIVLVSANHGRRITA